MADITSLLPYTVAQLTGCPLPLQNQALRIAGREFCRRSNRWREDIAGLVSVADQKPYTLVLDELYEGLVLIKEIVEVKYDGVEVSPSEYSFSRTENVLTFETAPSEADKTIDVKVVILPFLTTVEYGGDIIGEYGDALVEGALANLKANSGGIQTPVPWYDPGSANIHMAKFDTLIVDARVENERQRRGGDLSFPYLPFV